ncbi:hypothetical protein [Ferrovibrio sp.]|uniref:hypothetical protein n=1 Tax=Ferrovibrio sp. TaxID=1917215 RepID=UPI0035AFB04F
MDYNDLKQTYMRVFDSEDGEAVLDDLHRIVNQISIDGNSPNENAALYKVAQLALLRRIEKMCDGEAR